MIAFNETEYENLRKVVLETLNNCHPGTDVLASLRFAHLAIRAYDHNVERPVQNTKNIWDAVRYEDDLKQARIVRLTTCQEVAQAIERAFADQDEDLVPETPADDVGYAVLISAIGELVDSMGWHKDLPAEEYVSRLRDYGAHSSVLVSAHKMAAVIESLQSLGLVEN